MSDYGLRPDGSKKGRGFFGELKRPDGNVSTELSVGVGFDDQDMEIPTLVPTLTRSEINHLINGGEPNDAIVRKAVQHARSRIASGKGVFAGDDDEPVALPDETDQEVFSRTFNEAD